jgi:hypothetical protein
VFGADFHLTPLVETKSGLNTVFKNKEMELFLFYFRLGSFFLLTERGLISVERFRAAWLSNLDKCLVQIFI